MTENNRWSVEDVCSWLQASLERDVLLMGDRNKAFETRLLVNQDSKSGNDLSQCAADPRICTRHLEHSHTYHICLIALLHHSPDWAINESTGTRSGISIINRNTYRSSQSGAVRNSSWAVESRLTLQDTHTQNINIPNAFQNTHTFPTNPISIYSIKQLIMDLMRIYAYLTYKLLPCISCLRASAHTVYGEYGLDQHIFLSGLFLWLGGWALC